MKNSRWNDFDQIENKKCLLSLMMINVLLYKNQLKYLSAFIKYDLISGTE